MANKNRVYYGEYSLSHWVDLILQKNIELPSYQRSFVWGNNDVHRLISSLNKGYFVPPVTIAHYGVGEEKKNWIVDGQQRLTSILLFAIGYIPNRAKFDQQEETTAVGDDSNDENVEEDKNTPIQWTFRELVNLNKTLSELRESLRGDDHYTPIDSKDTGIKDVDDFLKRNYIGFSYIVVDDTQDQNQFSATLFRNINYWGIHLSSVESRRSLYYTNTSLLKFFDGKTLGNEDVLCNIHIQENLQPCKIDFVRYLSILSQYHVVKSAGKVLVGYSAYSTRENFYADYVSYLVGIEQNSRPNKFNGFSFENVFPNNEWQSRFAIVRHLIETLSEKMGLESKNNCKMFISWIDADYWLFGLLYVVLFEGKNIEIQNTGLAENITDAIKKKKQDVVYAKSPNRLGYLRNRIIESINIYHNYVS